MIPLSRFSEIIRAHKDQFDEDMNELIMAADILGERPHYFTMDDNGLFHVQASGSIEECIRALEHHLERLRRIKKQKDEMTGNK